MEVRIQAKGENTDFYQDVNFFELEGFSVENLFAGQTASIAVKNKVEIGDLIYTVSESGILPLFSGPSGNASVIAGGFGIIRGGKRPNDRPRCPSEWQQWRREWWEEFLEWFCARHPKHKWCNNN